MDTNTDTKKPAEDWMSKKWRPAMGWIYMITCTCDFILFPIMWAVVQTATHQPVTQWNPITLQGAGLYHLAMGAICGVAAWSRGQEKIAGANASSPTSGGGFGMGGMTSFSKPPMSPTATPSYRPPMSAMSTTKKVLPDTDMEDADARIR